VFEYGVQVSLYGGLCLIMYMAGLLNQQGSLSVGQVTAFLFYMLLLLFNFVLVADVLGKVNSVLGASHKLVEILQTESKINTKGGDKIEEADGTLSLKNVKFCYPSKPGVKVLRGVDIDIDNDKKRVIALCGTSGCGKSSIVSMAERFYDPQFG
jgi:ATP-binding cassette, subfamily B, bacterial